VGGEEDCFGLLTELLGSDAAQDLAPHGFVQLLEMDPEELMQSGVAAESARLVGIVGRMARTYAREVVKSNGELDIGELVTALRRTGIAVFDLSDGSM
jgi:hypothetical protein